jgi:predicted transcriptional regulator
MTKRIINLNDTDVKTALKIMMAESKINSLADIARELDIKETTFRSAINNNSIKLSLFIEIAKHLGYSVTIQSNE